MKKATLLVATLSSIFVSSSALAQYQSVVLDGNGAANAAYDGFQYGNSGGAATRWNGPEIRDPLTPSANFYSAYQGQVAGDKDGMAGLYTESTGTWVNLHPYSIADYSVAYGIWGSTQVGRGAFVSESGQKALLWHDTAASAVVLNPAGMLNCWAYGVYENNQVGFAAATQGSAHRATLWHGSAASAVSLHVAGAVTSEARAAFGEYQGGYFEDASGKQNAALWHGTADSVVNLMPAGWRQSFIWGMGSGVQVGHGTTPLTNARALAWKGTAESYVDLHALLPAEFAFDYSYATGVDPITGDIVGMAGKISGGQWAVMWSPTAVPEPATLAVLGLGSLIFARRRRK